MSVSNTLLPKLPHHGRPAAAGRPTDQALGTAAWGQLLLQRQGSRALRTSKYSRAWQTAMMALQTASGPIPASQSGVWQHKAPLLASSRPAT